MLLNYFAAAVVVVADAEFIRLPNRPRIVERSKPVPAAAVVPVEAVVVPVPVVAVLPLFMLESVLFTKDMKLFMMLPRMLETLPAAEAVLLLVTPPAPVVPVVLVLPEALPLPMLASSWENRFLNIVSKGWM